MFRSRGDLDTADPRPAGRVAVARRAAAMENAPARLPTGSFCDVRDARGDALMRPLRPFLRWLGRRRWIRFGVRDRVIRRFYHPGRVAPERFEESFFGLRYPGDLASYIDWSVYFFGAYCATELDLIDRLLAGLPDACVFDVGANAGHHTLFMARRARAVYAFEPVPTLADQVRARADLNRLAHVEVFGFGLGDAEGELPFSPSPDENTGTGSFAPVAGREATLKLPVRRGDAVYAELGRPRIDFVKIDVEGSEGRVLRGLSAMLRECRPLVLFEWSPRTSDDTGGAEPRSFLPGGYRLLEFRAERPRLALFARRRGGLQTWRARPAFEGYLLALPEERAELAEALPIEA